jgi:group I intron endonuclease
MTQDFSKGKIYKITNDYNDDVYVGSTCDTLVKRFSSHKSNMNCKEKFNRSLNVLMREIGKERFRIELIEDYPCKDKYELRQREGHYIRELGTLNSLIAGREKQENYQENREEILSKNKERYEKNKEKYLKTMNEKVQCECGCFVSRTNLRRHQQSPKHLQLLTDKTQHTIQTV